jgi:hypothetical protein
MSEHIYRKKCAQEKAINPARRKLCETEVVSEVEMVEQDPQRKRDEQSNDANASNHLLRKAQDDEWPQESSMGAYDTENC